MTQISSLVTAGAKNGPYLWKGGKIMPWGDATVHVTAVGHSSVSSVFEGIKAYWNPEHEELYVFRLADHMRRLLESNRIVRLDQPMDVGDLVEATIDLLRANETRRDTYIRPWTFIPGVVREQIAPADTVVETVIDTWPFESQMGTERGCRAAISSWARISDRSMPPRVKAFANYHNSRLATAEAKENGHDWPILLNEAGRVTEGPGACIALVRDGTVITPSLTSGVLDSITRSAFLDVASTNLALSVEEREVDRTELYVADELFFIGTGWEILPIYAIDGLKVGDGRMGVIARAFDERYHSIVRGNDPTRLDWLTPVWRR
jgi:branched-chain amino acid aminotransferase